MKAPEPKEKELPYVKVGEENGKAIDLSYADHGSGTPAVLVHD